MKETSSRAQRRAIEEFTIEEFVALQALILISMESIYACPSVM
jgi:hypothetical protein